MIIDLLDDMTDRADVEYLPPGRHFEVAEGHDCDGCGHVSPDVDLFAEDSETGEELWLCQACGEW